MYSEGIKLLKIEALSRAHHFVRGVCPTVTTAPQFCGLMEYKWIQFASNLPCNHVTEANPIMS